ncbi:MAG: ABC transporter ATP-binding protein [Prevotellaceae bacterium]|nr:ABC transporter ATP-binding protein [Prevotellaceae bacterium]
MFKKLKSLLQVPVSHYGTKEIFRWLWAAWRGNRLQAVLNAVIGLVSVVVSLMQVSAVKHAIDVASGTEHGNLYVAVGVMGALILSDFALNIAAIWVRNLLGIKAQNRMQQAMLDRILRSEWRGRERMHSGDVLNRLEFDVNNVVTFLTETIPSALSVLAMFIGAFFYLFSMDWLLAIITVAILPIFLAVSKIYVRQMRSLTRMVRDWDSKVQSTLQETIQHRMLIKTLESDKVMVDRLEDTQSELRRRVVNRTKFSVFSNLMINFGFALGYLVAFLWAAVRMSMHTLSFGGMTAFLQLVNKIQSPARNLAKLIPAFVSVFTAAERLMELEEDPLEEQGEPIWVPAPCGLRLSHVSYAYDKADGKVIDNLSFDFRPGTCTAVLGETGAGKTTLIRLLLALIKPKEGKIEIYEGKASPQPLPQGEGLSKSHPFAQTLSPLHRCNFVYVPQGNTLLSGTIRDNLLLGKLDATEEEMKTALHISCADFVFELPNGLDTVCSEQGGGLSEGQAQRIAIARSLLRAYPSEELERPGSSILVFDEATSALDPETEKQLLENILSRHDKTVIFITHRMAVTQYCDQVLKIEKIHH